LYLADDDDPFHSRRGVPTNAADKLIAALVREEHDERRRTTGRNDTCLATDTIVRAGASGRERADLEPVRQATHIPYVKSDVSASNVARRKKEAELKRIPSDNKDTSGFGARRSVRDAVAGHVRD
jgi:hypothetical protein